MVRLRRLQGTYWSWFRIVLSCVGPSTKFRMCRIENVGHWQTHETSRNSFVVFESRYNDPKSLNEFVLNVLKMTNFQNSHDAN